MHLKAKELERLCMYRAEREEMAGIATMARYGVHAVFIEDKWSPIDSLPDFEGVLAGGRQFITDAKVCSQASFPLDNDKFKDRQLRHMLRRAQFGVITFLTLHFNPRDLKKTVDASVTWAFPVKRDHAFWEAADRKEVKRISRMDCEQYAERIMWSVVDGCRTESPDIISAVKRLAPQFGKVAI